jgi:hypothetical protein
MNQLDLYIKVASDWIESFIVFCKMAWQQPHAPELLGSAMVALVLLVIIRKFKGRYKPIKLFDNRAGVVEVSRKALDELVQSVCYSLGALNRPDVTIYTLRGRLCMNVSLKLESGQRLTDATSEIQTALTSAFREHLGVEKLGRIDVRITGFKGLIYKPSTKFLPPTPDSKDNDALLSDDQTLFNSGEEPKKNS